jgi:hypothetical protein
VCCGFLQHVRSGQVVTDAERETLATAIEAVRTTRGEHTDEGRVAAPEQRAEGAA